MYRRSLLATFGSLSVTGCIGRGASGGDPSTEADSDGPGWECDTADRLPIDLDEYDVRRTNAYGFSLEVSPAHPRLGSDVAVTLENVSDRAAITGSRNRYAIQRLTDGEWQHLFGVPEETVVLYKDVGIQHDPGSGFEWTFTLRREALETDIYRVCSPIRPGRYRFVYLGLAGSENQAIAEMFEVRDR